MTEEIEITRDQQPIGAVVQAGSAALAKTDQIRAVAEVQAQIIMARNFPRDERACYDKIMIACQRPGLAERGLYNYARGGTDIEGPSIRLAETCARLWHNINYGRRELEQVDDVSHVQAYAWDTETNVRAEIAFPVPHKRYSKAKGLVALTDPRDIYEAVANQAARRVRACILAVIPGDVIEAAVAECRKTITAKADMSPVGIKRMLDAFAQIGVTKEMIEKRIQRNMEAIQPAHIVSLGNIRNSLLDGMSKIADWFEVGEVEVVPGQTRTDQLKALLPDNGKAAPPPDGLTAEQGAVLERVSEVLLVLAGANAAKSKSLLSGWSGGQVASLTSLAQRPDLISIVCARADITLREKKDAEPPTAGKQVAAL